LPHGRRHIHFIVLTSLESNAAHHAPRAPYHQENRSPIQGAPGDIGDFKDAELALHRSRSRPVFLGTAPGVPALFQLSPPPCPTRTRVFRAGNAEAEEKPDRSRSPCSDHTFSTRAATYLLAQFDRSLTDATLRGSSPDCESIADRSTRGVNRPWARNQGIRMARGRRCKGPRAVHQAGCVFIAARRGIGDSLSVLTCFQGVGGGPGIQSKGKKNETRAEKKSRHLKRQRVKVVVSRCLWGGGLQMLVLTLCPVGPRSPVIRSSSASYHFVSKAERQHDLSTPALFKQCRCRWSRVMPPNCNRHLGKLLALCAAATRSAPAARMMRARNPVLFGQRRTGHAATPAWLGIMQIKNSPAGPENLLRNAGFANDMPARHRGVKPPGGASSR